MSADADGHRYFEGMAVAHVLGGLDESEGRVFRNHLMECSECRAQVGELRALAHELQDVERDERRVRAAKSIETKRRERSDEDDEAEAPPTVTVAPRAYRVLALVAVLLLAGLGVWNYTLRSTVANQESLVTNVTDAAELLVLGTRVTELDHPSELDVDVRRDDRRAVLLMRGLESGAHAVYQLDSADGVLDTHTVTATEGRIFLLVPLREGVEQLVVMVDPGEEVPPGLRGARMLTAQLSDS